MTVHKLSVGDGYTYLTRQVAGADIERRADQSAADYYTAEGNPPGIWMGAGIEALSLAEGETVREEQMKNLFGLGLHPDAEALVKAYVDQHLRPDASEAEAARVWAKARAMVKLGQAFPEYKTLEPFADRVAKRLNAIEEETGRPAIESEVKKVKREEATRQRTSVAGYDLVFSPVKSVSLLWALHPERQVRDQVRSAHDAAVKAVIGLLEQHAAFTRAGVGGVAQLETKGLVAAAFHHFDSRSGDPDLHNHLAIVNKVQGVDGKWRSLDGTALYAIGVAASETYNTTLEAEMTARLGVVFADRPGPTRNARPVREIVGVDPELVKHFSSRRKAINTRYIELRAEYRALHGREPDGKTLYDLAQQATLETRGAKDTPRSLDRMRTEWTQQVTARFSRRAITDLTAAVHTDLKPIASLTPEQVTELTTSVVQTVSEERATWTRWNLHAETMRQLRSGYLFTSPEAMTAAADLILQTALGSGKHAIRITVPAPVETPTMLQRSDGSSVFTKHEGDRYTTRAILDAETRLVEAAQTPTVFTVGTDRINAAVCALENATGRTLDQGQRNLVASFASDDRLLAVGIGPAGSGKTTAMRAFRDVLAGEGRRLIGLAPSANAAKVLETELGVRCETVDKLLWDLSPGNRLSGPELTELLRERAEYRAGLPAPRAAGWKGWRPRLADQIRPGDVLLVDEASMAGTLNLDRVTAVAAFHGAQVRLLGDPYQLGAVASGGAMRLIANKVGAVELTEVHRFKDPAFAAASLQLRVGDSAGLDYFEDRGRLLGGTREAMIEALYQGWKTDMAAGKTTIMLAGANETVAELSERARADRIAAGLVKANGIPVAGSNTAGKGDWIVTRVNNSQIRYCRGKDHVRNGQVWTVARTYRNGALKVKAHDSRATAILPPEYVKDHVELAYAATVARSQGLTVDTMHPLLTDNMDRSAFYVLSTRAALVTTLYAVTHEALPVAPDDRTWRPGWDPDATAAREIAELVLAKEPDDIAATEAIEDITARAESLQNLVPQYRFAADLAAEHHYRALLETALKPRLDAEQWTEVLDTGIGPIARALAAAEHHGWNPEQLLARTAARSFDDADSATAVLLHRIEKLTDAHPAPPPGQQPEPRDVSYYAKLLRDHHPRLVLDPDIALNLPATAEPATAASPIGPADTTRYRTELAQVLGTERAEAITSERAWPALVGALTRAEDTGQHSLDALNRAVAQRELTGLDSYSEVLSWRIGRQTRLIAHDPTHAGQAWPAIAWTLKAWETRTGRDAAHLVDALAPGRGLSNLALAIADTAAKEAQQERLQNNPTGLPWIAYPAQILEGDTVPEPLRAFLAALGDAIRTRTDNLADHALADRAVWSETFGPEPTDPTQREALHGAIRIAAAYRDQHRIDDDNPAHPFGPYPETGRAGHREWWAAAGSSIAEKTLDRTETKTGLDPNIEHQLAAAIAHDLYRALPEIERRTIDDKLAAQVAPAHRPAFERDPETVICHPQNATALLIALADHGHLTPAAAAGLGITKPHLDEKRQATAAKVPKNAPQIVPETPTIEPAQHTISPTTASRRDFTPRL